MTALRRWSALEKRIVEALPQDAPGIPAVEIHARLGVIAGNEWIVTEALEDLVSSGAVDSSAEGDERGLYLRTA